MEKNDKNKDSHNSGFVGFLLIVLLFSVAANVTMTIRSNSQKSDLTHYKDLYDEAFIHILTQKDSLEEIANSYYVYDPHGYLYGAVVLRDYGEVIEDGIVYVPPSSSETGGGVYAHFRLWTPPVVESSNGEGILTVPMSKGSVVILYESNGFLELAICPMLSEECVPSFFPTAIAVPKPEGFPPVKPPPQEVPPLEESPPPSELFESENA